MTTRTRTVPLSGSVTWLTASIEPLAAAVSPGKFTATFCPTEKRSTSAAATGKMTFNRSHCTRVSTMGSVAATCSETSLWIFVTIPSIGLMILRRSICAYPGVFQFLYLLLFLGGKQFGLGYLQFGLCMRHFFGVRVAIGLQFLELFEPVVFEFDRG